jgi:hypothetical protein
MKALRKVRKLLLDMTSRTPLADAIKKEVFEQKRNYSIIITGKPQMRKSTVGLALSLEINPNFSFEEDFAIIKTKQYLDILDKPSKRGDVKLLDEFGVGLNHRQWYTFLNNAMISVMETHGHEGKIVIVTVPYEDYVDKDALKLFDMRIEVLNKNDRKRYAICKVEELQYNQKTKTLYAKFPRGRYPDGTIKRLEVFYIGYPTQEMLNKYFEISGKEKMLLKADLRSEAVAIEKEKIKKIFNPETYVEQILQNPDKFVKTIWGRKYVSREIIMNEFLGIGDTRARQIKRMAEERLGISATL